MLVREKLNDNQLILNVNGIIELNDDQLYEFCIKNDEVCIERTQEGELVMMLPVGSEGGSRESDLIYFLQHWNKKYKLGKVFSSSAGFTLSNGAMRSPDVAFIIKERWKALPLLQRKKFAPICPDFIVELRSETDNLGRLKQKMEEWIENDCRLGWLIDPLEEKAYIYKPDETTQIIDSFDEKLSGEKLLPSFELSLSELRVETE